MGKMGRPTDNPRTNKLNLRLSDKELHDIQLCADAMGVPRIEAINAAVALLKDKLNITE